MQYSTIRKRRTADNQSRTLPSFLLCTFVSWNCLDQQAKSEGQCSYHPDAHDNESRRSISLSHRRTFKAKVLSSDANGGRFWRHVFDPSLVGRSSLIFNRKSSTSAPTNSRLGTSDFPVETVIDFESERSGPISVVVCGGGEVGISIAFHLALAGWGDRTIVVDQGRLGGMTTSWRGSGIVGALKKSKVEAKMVQESIKLYQTLSQTHPEINWQQRGSLLLARKKDRMIDFKRMKAMAGPRGIDCEILLPIQAKEKCPYIRIDDLQGALWIPEDGVADSQAISLTLAKLASSKGVRFYENCGVKEVRVNANRVSSIVTTKGEIECQYFVNACGLWARKVGTMSDPVVKIPLQPCDHYYLHTKPVEGLEPLPVTFDLDGGIYFREKDGRFLCGGFQPCSKPAFENGLLPENTEEIRLEEDWDAFHVLLQEILHRVPSLGKTYLDQLWNTPEVFSADGSFIIGESPEITHYFVAAGMKSIGISASGGIGSAIAQWIVQGQAPFDCYELEIKRFLGLHNNARFLRERIVEVPAMTCAIHYPQPEFHTSRCLRTSPIFPKLQASGAVFGQVMGYERPAFFDRSRVEDASGESPPFTVASTPTFHRPPWFDLVKAEYEACRERVALADYSSFTKIDLWSHGTEVVSALQYLCSNNVDIPVGGITHSGMQNHRGGYENDVSVARIAHNRYMMIAPTIQQARCQSWLNKHLPSDGSVFYRDVTSMYTAICVIGPMSRHLLSELTDTDMSPKEFPFFTFQEIDVGLASGIRALNLTHTGELGWVLYIPNEYALHVFDRLMHHGEKYGIQLCGYYAMRSLRIEKFYAFWGQDLDSDTTPLECGRSFRVKYDKEFIGKQALIRQREEGIKKLLVQLQLEDHDPDLDLYPSSSEPIYRNGKYAGSVTTSCYGFTFERPVCVGFIHGYGEAGEPLQNVTPEYIMAGQYSVDVSGTLFPAKVYLNSPSLPSKYPEPIKDRYIATQFAGRSG